MTEIDEIDSIPTAEVYAENEKGSKRDWNKFLHVIVKLEAKGFVFFQGFNPENLPIFSEDEKDIKPMELSVINTVYQSLADMGQKGIFLKIHRQG